MTLAREWCDQSQSVTCYTDLLIFREIGTLERPSLRCVGKTGTKEIQIAFSWHEVRAV